MKEKSFIRSVEEKKEYMLYVSFFLLGLNAYKLYLPIFFVLIVLLIFNRERYKVSKEYIYLTFLMLLSVLPLYFLGKERMTTFSPINQLAVFVFLIVIAGFFLQKQKIDVKKNLIVFFVLGVGFESIVIASYSYFIDPIKYGYGLLYNPFLGVEQNSPGVSNNLSVLAALLIYFIIDNQSVFKRFFSFCFLCWVLFLAVFLGGRTFFVILMFSLTFILFNQIEIKKSLVILFSIVILIFVLGEVEGVSEHLSQIVERFSKGLQSKRFQHYAHGLNEILNYPLGGYQVDKNIENIEWFHNVFLDNGRLGGWLPVIALFSMIIYISSSFFLKKNKYFVLAFTLFLVCFLLMQQDVVIEGESRNLILIFFLGILLLTKENSTTLPLRD